MVLRVDMRLADGGNLTGGYKALTATQKNDVIAHEKVHRNALITHFREVRDLKDSLNAVLTSLSAGADQRQMANDLVTNYTPKMKTYLNATERVEKIRKFYHLDQLDEHRWDSTATTIFISSTKTYIDNVNVALLQRQFSFLPGLLTGVTTVDEASPRISAKLAARKQELEDQVWADIYLMEP